MCRLRSRAQKNCAALEVDRTQSRFARGAAVLQHVPHPGTAPLGQFGRGTQHLDLGPQRLQEDPEGSGNMKLFGTDPAPLTNTPPVTGESDTPLGETSGIDPHDTVIEESPLIRKQIADFLKTDGKVTNPCGLNPCYAAKWKGMP